MEEDNKLQTFTLQMQLPAPNLEVAKRVADEAQRLIDIYGYYNFLNLVEFMKQNPSMVQMGLSLINKNNAVMEEMKFKSLQRGDLVFTLERDRRSMYPIFDRAKVVKVGESKPRANLIEIVLQDSIGTVTVYLPSDGNEGIYNNVYYTLIGSNIVNEVSLQRSQALGIINNVGKYENIIKECDNILAMFENKEPTNGSQFNEEFASFRKDVVSVLQSQQQAINLMMDSLGLNKPKENPDGK